jgi:hypothetical protein
MQLKFILPIIFMLLFFVSCSKNEEVKTEVLTYQVTNALVASIWTITSFSKNGNGDTNAFYNMSLSFSTFVGGRNYFYSNGSSKNINGFWQVFARNDIAILSLSLYSPPGITAENLTREWTIEKYENNKIFLSYIGEDKINYQMILSKK